MERKYARVEARAQAANEPEPAQYQFESGSWTGNRFEQLEIAILAVLDAQGNKDLDIEVDEDGELLRVPVEPTISAKDLLFIVTQWRRSDVDPYENARALATVAHQLHQCFPSLARDYPYVLPQLLKILQRNQN